MKCKKCRGEIPDGSKFCMLCGARQEREKRKTLKRANGTGTVYKLQGRRKRPWAAAKNRTIIRILRNENRRSGSCKPPYRAQCYRAVQHDVQGSV